MYNQRIPTRPNRRNRNHIDFEKRFLSFFSCLEMQEGRGEERRERSLEAEQEDIEERRS